MPEFSEAEIDAKLGSVSYEFSEPVSLLDISIDTWDGAALTHVSSELPLSFMIENRSFRIARIRGRLPSFTHPGTIDLGGGFCSNIPDQPSEGTTGGPLTALSIFFAPTLLEHILDVEYSPGFAASNVRAVRSTESLGHLMTALLVDARAGSPGGPLVGESILAAIACMLHPIEIGKHEIKDRRKAVLPSRTLSAIKELVHSDVSKPLHLSELAATAKMSIRHFSRSFRESTGLTPHQFILRARVDLAKDLIAKSELPYEQIAWSTGFSDRNHMSTVFRKLLGVPPSHFRRS